MILLRLFIEYFKVGLFSIGGGAATVPFLYELSEKTGWFTAVELTNMIAISESTPGAFGVNMASYVGYTVSGIVGCIVATLGLIAPSIIVIIIISYFLRRFRDNKYVDAAFRGLRPASLALISVACLQITRVALLREDLYALTGSLTDLLNPLMLLMAIVLFLLIRKFKWHPLFFIAISAVAGIILKLGV